MHRLKRKPVVCQVCKQAKSVDDVLPASAVREPIEDEIRKDHPEWSPDGFICLDDLDRYRAEYVRHSLEEEKGELSELEKDVIRTIQEEEVLSTNLNAEFDSKLSFGERLSDRVAAFGGSWKFIVSFAVILVVWVVINSVALLRKPFDPYPFILLNLVLSSLAAFQAPIIMMSQNRQEAKDRLHAENDYKVNLKAELEIRNLSQKMDHLLHQQWQRLLEIQEIQTELMQELARTKNGQNHK